MAVEVARSLGELSGLRGPWEDLSEDCAEPNVFYHPMIFIPAFEYLREEEVRCVFVFEGEPRNSPLIGFFPVAFKRAYGSLPLHYISLWRHIHCFLCTPLLRKGREREAISGFFAWWYAARDAGVLLAANLISRDGRFHEMLMEFLRSGGYRVDSKPSFQRAILRTTLSPEDYIQAAIPRKKRKELKRREERLAQLGGLSHQILQPDGSLDVWLEDFYRLEQSGWKGRLGTALAQIPSHRDFFSISCREALACGRLLMTRLMLGEKPIAMTSHFISGRAAFAFKIAFDENFRQNSPGVLHHMQVIHYLLRDGRVDWMDSCAEPDHPMLNHILSERREIFGLNIAHPRSPMRFFLPALSRLRGFKRARPLERQAVTGD